MERYVSAGVSTYMRSYINIIVCDGDNLNVM